MTDTLSPAQTAMLERAASSDTPIEIAPEARRTARILVRLDLLTAEGEAFAVTAAGRSRLGLPAELTLVARTPDAPATRLPRADTKAAKVIELLSQPEGATVVVLSEATGWLPHSVRGFLAGALKKKHGLSLLSDPADGGRVYRIGPEASRTSGRRHRAHDA